MLARGQSQSPESEGEKEAQPSGRTRRALASPAWFREQPPAPLTHPLRPPPAPALLAVRGGPRGGQRPGRIRAPGQGGRGRATRAALLTWRSESRCGQWRPCPGPRVVPAPGSPEPAHGRPPPPPAPVLQGSRCAGVPRPAARAASGRARGELWLRVCDQESRDPRSLRPSSSPTYGLLLSSGAAPAAPWRPPREAPALNPPARPRGAPYRRR